MSRSVVWIDVFCRSRSRFINLETRAEALVPKPLNRRQDLSDPQMCLSVISSHVPSYEYTAVDDRANREGNLFAIKNGVIYVYRMPTLGHHSNQTMIEAAHGVDETLPQAKVVAVRKHLQSILNSTPFRGSRRSQQFLTLVIDHVLNGRFEAVTERMLGVEMFGRPIAYDTANDPVVRVKASEVRRKIAQFYHETPGPHAVRIELPLGSYAPKFYFAMPQAVKMLPTVEVAQPEKLLTPLSQEEPVDSEPETRSPLRRVSGIGGILLFVLFITVWQFHIHRSKPADGETSHNAKKRLQPGQTSSPFVLGVGAFESSGIGADTLASGLRLDLIDSLGELPHTRILADASTRTLKLDDHLLQQTASLGMNIALFGNLKLEADTFHLRAVLVRGEDATQLASFNYSGRMQDIVNLQERIRRDIFAELQLSGSQVRGTGTTTDNPNAYEQYLLGRFHSSQNTKASLLEAIEDYQQSINYDRLYARPFCALAFVYFTMESRQFEPADLALQKASAAIEQAIRINPDLAEAHFARGILVWRRDWSSINSERELKRAAEIGPDRASIHRELAELYVDTGRFDDATSQLELARQFGSNNPSLAFAGLYIATLAHDCPRVMEAIAQLDTLMKGSSLALNQEATALWYCDRDRDAIRTWRAMAVADKDNSRIQLEDRGLIAWEKGGRRRYAESRLEAIKRGGTSPLHSNDFIREEWASMAGDDQAAVAIIKKRFKDHDPQFLADMSNPSLAGLFRRSDLQTLVHQVVN